MTDHVAPAQSTQADDVKSKRLILPLMIIAGVLAAILLVCIGIGIGMAKRHFERKVYVEQIAKLKAVAVEAVGRYQESEARVEKMREMLKTKQDEIHELELKLDEAQQNADDAVEQKPSVVAPSTPASKAVTASHATVMPQFAVKGDCILSTSQKGTNWKDCLGISQPVQPDGKAPKATIEKPLTAKPHAGH